MKILIVDDHPLVRKGIVSTVDFDEDIKEILEASKIEEAIKIIDKGSVPVKLEEISTISSSAIVDLNRQSKMG
ncbi:MAG: response regulator transcription factor, partial [Tissierellia bacterium]|nr:response regulator transcription factor [Tissierellia bacterium]